MTMTNHPSRVRMPRAKFSRKMCLHKEHRQRQTDRFWLTCKLCVIAEELGYMMNSEISEYVHQVHRAFILILYLTMNNFSVFNCLCQVLRTAFCDIEPQ